MIKSMTGFGSQEADVSPLGKVNVELKSSNHKFLEVVFHLPEELFFLEDKIKKIIEAKVKRGRLTCVITVMGVKSSSVYINRDLLQSYISKIRGIKEQFKIRDEVGINTLIHLPGVLSLGASKVPRGNLWPKMKTVVSGALDGLVKMRQKEGRSTFGFLKTRAEALSNNLNYIKSRFRKVLKEKLAQIPTDEERSAFIKDTDIAEEIERLAFHIRNFKSKIVKNGSVGKELDFIAQEMQREANTLAAKSFLASISSRVVQMKSQIEKIREQVQNIE
ncbi:MAG: YicC/YloC family endoribonuclease [Candidatus Omnitrophota bacterium]